MRPALLLLASLAATAGLASADEVVVTPSGDAVATVLAVTGQGNASCYSTWCTAASLAGDAACASPYCLSVAEGDSFCQALYCAAVSVFGNASAVGRLANTDDNQVLAASVFGDATSSRTRSDQHDAAVSGTGDASSDEGVAISLTGNASSRQNTSFGGCSDLGLCLDPA